MPFLGPAFVASVAYMDPGNFATNIQAGANYGYMLLWVLLMSNLMAILIQSLSAKLGIASGMTLPQAIRMHTSRDADGLWLTARPRRWPPTCRVPRRCGRHGDPVRLGLLPSALITAAISFGLLAVEQRGHRRFEALIFVFVGDHRRLLRRRDLHLEPLAGRDPAGHAGAPDPLQRHLRGGRHGRGDRDATRRLPPLRASSSTATRSSTVAGRRSTSGASWSTSRGR